MKAIMAGQRLPLRDRVLSWVDVYRGYRSGKHGNVSFDMTLHRRMCQAIETHLGRRVAGLRILDLGCGQRAQQVALFAAGGARVVGIDVEVPTLHLNARTLLRVYRENGLERAAKAAVRHVLFDASFFAQLATAYGAALPLAELDLRLMDAAALDFADDEFDVIYSTSAFEHMHDVGSVLEEINRVLRPGGLAWVAVHLFACASGGHHTSERVPPWDHLLDRRFPPTVFLNRLRLADFRRLFADHLQVVGEELQRDDDRLLTPSLAQRLSAAGFERDELLTNTVTFICRKRAFDPPRA